MCSESSFRHRSSSGQMGGQHDGGISSITPGSDGVDRHSVRSTPGRDDSGNF